MNLLLAVETISRNPAQTMIRIKAAASGMLAVAESAVAKTSFFEDTRVVLDQLVLAKAQLDIAAWHSPEVTGVTSQLLSSAQSFVHTETIPCTEWPSPAEVVEVVRKAANELGAA